MQMVGVYKCLCDARRLRILNLLLRQPLCVCHLQTLLGEPQVKVSQQLAVLRRAGLVEAERKGTWMIYRLPRKPGRLLRKQLACLQDCAAEDPLFRQDLQALRHLLHSLRDQQHPLLASCRSNPSTATPIETKKP